MTAFALCIVGLFWLALKEGVEAPPKTPSQPEAYGAIDPAVGHPLSESAALVRSQANEALLQISGIAAWDDGKPAEGVRIRCGKDHVHTDANGHFELPVGQAPEIGSSLPVLAPCWIHEGSSLVQAGTDLASGSDIRLTLPTRVDVRFAMDVDDVALSILQTQGRDTLHIIASSEKLSLTAASLGHLELALTSTTLRGVLEVKSTEAAVRIRAQFGGGPKWGYDHFEEPVVLPLTRGEVPVVHMSVGRANVLQIQVVDHAGHYVPGCKLLLTSLEDLLPVELDRGRTSHRGEYFYLGTPGRRISVEASHKTITRTEEVTLGSTDVLEISLDLSRLVRVRVTKSGRACEAFECGLRPWLFGRRDERPLSSWTDGVLWIDPAEAEQPLFFCWMDNGSFREQRFVLPRAVDGNATIDLDSLPPPQCSRIDIKGWDGSRRLYISIELLQPIEALPLGERQKGKFAQHGMHFLSVPWGRYRLRVTDLSLKSEIHSTEIEVGPGPCEIDLTDCETSK